MMDVPSGGRWQAGTNGNRQRPPDGAGCGALAVRGAGLQARAGRGLMRLRYHPDQGKRVTAWCGVGQRGRGLQHGEGLCAWSPGAAQLLRTQQTWGVRRSWRRQRGHLKWMRWPCTSRDGARGGRVSDGTLLDGGAMGECDSDEWQSRQRAVLGRGQPRPNREPGIRGSARCSQRDGACGTCCVWAASVAV